MDRPSIMILVSFRRGGAVSGENRGTNPGFKNPGFIPWFLHSTTMATTNQKQVTMTNKVTVKDR